MLSLIVVNLGVMRSEYLDSQSYKIIARWSSLSLPFSIPDFQTRSVVKRSCARIARLRHFSFFAFTPSPILSITLSFSQLGVKTFAFEPSPESGECFAKIASTP
ncbi:MAG: hypothetical protein HXL30_03585 [Prevotellaceae bacterium]|nr:hypothetical protein [Prevotellaceae bacterium]